MKRLLLSVVVAVLTIIAKAQTEPQYVESFKYDKRVHDFGTILEKDGKVSHTFTFTNTGIVPVVISDVNSWCGCTTAEFTKTPVMPGKKAEVKVTYNPNLRPGKFSKEVILNLDGNKGYTRIWIKGNVIPYRHPVKEDYPYYFGNGLYMGFKVFSFPPLSKGSTYRVVQRLSNETDKEMTIEFTKNPDNKVLKMPKKITLKPKERTTFSVTYKAPVTHYANRHINIGVKVNGNPAESILVKWLGSSQQFTR